MIPIQRIPLYPLDSIPDPDTVFATNKVNRTKLQRDSGMPKTSQNKTMAKPEIDFRYKQCLIIRNDIKMSCGKRCAQAAHASIGAYNNADKSLQKSWLSEGQKKVVLRANDERTLYELKVIAERVGISSSLIQDAGMTEIPPGTITALGLGPAKSEDLDKITGTLSLL
jgi:PTH2 family peptidyl-tRNA hydrolase